MTAKRGFTLIEAVIVILIIGVLSVVSVPIFRGYTRRAMLSEGRSLVNAVNRAERAYFAECGAYLPITSTGYNSTLRVDARMNKYFQTYAVTVSGTYTGNSASLQIVSPGANDAAGITITLNQNWDSDPVLTEAGI